MKEDDNEVNNVCNSGLANEEGDDCIPHLIPF